MSESFGAIALELIEVVLCIIQGKSVIVAIREGDKRQAVGRRTLDHATVGTNGDGKGYLRSQVNEALSELEGRVDMALRWECNEKEVSHDILVFYWILVRELRCCGL